MVFRISRIIEVEKNQYYPEIRRYVESKIGNSADVEDLTQQVFLEYFKAKQRENKPQNPKSYLLGTARIKVADYYRKKKKPKLVLFKSELHDKLLNLPLRDTSGQNKVTEELEIIFSQLPPKSREAITLRFIDNLKPKEAAIAAGCSINVF